MSLRERKKMMALFQVCSVDKDLTEEDVVQVGADQL
jgi:hypothetical protein